MNTRETEVIIVGVGSVGSMAAWQLARQGIDVVAIDRFPIPGPFSAYAGESRIFRKVYAEGGHYTPLLQRAEEQWRQLEGESETELLALTGAVTIADEDHPDLRALLNASEANDLPYKLARGGEARKQFPGHNIQDSEAAFFDPQGGYVRSERAVMAALQLAAAKGASLLSNRKVRSIESGERGWTVTTDQEVVIAPKVIVATGTGSTPVTNALGTVLAVRPQILTWFPMKTQNAYSGPGAPVFLRRSGDARFYGFPSADGWTVKVAASVYLDDVDSMERPLTWDPDHLATIRSWVAEFLPDLVPEPIRTTVCADGYTSDSTGLLGPVPGMPGVVVAVGFSGHGFKMASALGAVAADYVLTGSSKTNVSYMDPARFMPEGRTLNSLTLA
jgi:sarcosine oxidase